MSKFEEFTIGGHSFMGERVTEGDYAVDWNGSPYVEVSTYAAASLLARLSQNLVDHATGELEPGTVQTVADIAFQLANAARRGETVIVLGEGLTIESGDA